MTDECTTSSLPLASSSPPEISRTVTTSVAPDGTAYNEIPGEFDVGTSSPPPGADDAGSKKQSLVGKIGTCFLMVYLGGVSLSFPYFTWSFIKEHTFLEWLIFGEFVPVGKALIWPYYAVSSLLEKGWTQEEKENLAHFKRGTIAAQKAWILLEGFANARQPTPTDAARILELLNDAVDESKLVRDDVLAKVHPDFQKMYREKCVVGLTRLVRVLEASPDDAQKLDEPEFATANRLLDEWDDWLDCHRELRIPKRHAGMTRQWTFSSDGSKQREAENIREVRR